MEGFRVRVDEDSIRSVEEYVEEQLDLAEVPMKLANRMNIAVDEIYSNIAYYSGAQWAEVSVSVAGNTVTVCLRDDGKPYDPLAKEDPDVTASAEERDIGGLGIFMTKKLMSEVRYRYANGQNETQLILNLK